MPDPVEPPDAALPLPVLVARTRERLTAFLADTDPAGADWVERVRSTRPATPTVMVVGETNRGKSSLVNALLAAPGLSPVEPTASYLVLRHGPGWAATAHHPGAHSVAVPIGAPAQSVCLDGAGPPGGALPPRYLDVQVPVPLLARLTLVDTPGVGGLDDPRGELARVVATTATALLFVLDASAPITRGELDFLARLGDQVETVLFALTKTDVHRGWRRILDTDADLLARHAPRFAGAVLHPVSARLFEQAARAPTPRVAALLREQSGVAALQRVLQQQVGGRVAMLGEANTLRALATTLDGLVVRLQARQRALDSGDAQAAALRARRDELVAARGSPARGWQLRLRAQLQRARVAATHEVAGQVRAAQTRLGTAIDVADRAALAQLPHQVDAILQVMATRVAAGLAARLGRVAETTLAELFTPDELVAVRAALVRGEQPLVTCHPPAARPATAEDKLLVAVGFSGGVGLGRLAVLPLAGLGATAGFLALPVVLALGLGAGWWTARTRQHAADRAHLRQWLSDVLAQARSTLDRTMAEQLIDAEQQLTLTLEDALLRRVAAIEEELREVDRALRLGAAERSRAMAAGRTHLAVATAGQAQVAALLARIRELRDRPG